jgi:phosphatidylglycerol:prolipoprotein diacylglycerol transferase
MIPELFRIGNFAVSPFGVMLVLSFLAAYWQLARGLRALRAGDEDDASAIVLAGGLGGIAGAKIYYAILYGDWRLLYDRAGLVWYGGFLLGTLAVLWTLRRRRLSFWAVLDAATPALALGYAVGRVGCFLVGDDYGRPTDLPWGVAFPEGLPPTTAGSLRDNFGLAIPSGVSAGTVLRVHPTQIYETLAALSIWLVGRRLLARESTAVPRRPSAVALPMFALLAVERFLVEFLRAKDDRFLAGLTLAQAISLGVLVVMGMLWLGTRRAS